jgi:lipoprotein-anchoring transpeptidase ErfK/SrfK
MEIYQNEKLLASATQENAKISVDLSEQRTKLLVSQMVAVDAPCCTFKAGKRTPTGTFPVKEKIKDKRSNIFDSLYRNGRKVYGGDCRKYGGSYDRYVGSSLLYWMRLTDDGIGLHASKYVHRFPKSNGCIRVPQAAISAIYSAVEPGTTVQVVP